MNILFTLCGRAGSKGFKNKNLKKFIDIPLVYYGIAGIKGYIERFSENNHIDVVLNTDSEDLISLVLEQESVEVNVIERVIDLSGDAVPKTAVIKDCLTQMENRNNLEYDMVVDLDITSPLRTIMDIHNAIKTKNASPEKVCTFSVTDARRNPYFNMVMEKEGGYVTVLQSTFTTRQQAPAIYDMNASIYAYDASALKKCDMDTFFDNPCNIIIMKDTGILDIDSEEDYELMQVIAKYLFENDEGFREVYEMARGIC